jgi:hypothetical protein
MSASSLPQERKRRNLFLTTIPPFVGGSTSALSQLTGTTARSQVQQALGAFSPSGKTELVLDDTTCASGPHHSSFFSGGQPHFDSLKVGKMDHLHVLFRLAVH